MLRRESLPGKSFNSSPKALAVPLI